MKEEKTLQLPNDIIVHSFVQKEGAPKVFEEVSRVWVRSFYIPTTYRGIPFGGHYHFPFALVTVFSPSYVCDAQGLILKGGGITPLYHESHFKIDYPTRIAGVGGIQRCDIGGVPIDVEAYSIVEGKKLRHFRFERIMNINGLGGIGDEYTFGLWCVDYERSTPFYDYLTGRWNTCIYICLSLPRGMPSGEVFKFIVRDKLHPEIIYLEEKHTKLSSENFWVFQEHITFIESTTKPESISLKIEVYRPTTATSPTDSLNLEGGFTPPTINGNGSKTLLYTLLGIGTIGASVYILKKGRPK